MGLKNWNRQLSNKITPKKQTSLVLNVLITLLVLAAFSSCTSQKVVTSAEKINYRDAYFELMEQNKKYVFENEKLKYENSKLFFNNYAENFVVDAETDSESPC